MTMVMCPACGFTREPESNEQEVWSWWRERQVRLYAELHDNPDLDEEMRRIVAEEDFEQAVGCGQADHYFHTLLPGILKVFAKEKGAA